MTDSGTRPRVLILSLAYYPRFVGGAEVAIKEITDRMPEIEFHLVTLRYDSSLPKLEEIGNVIVHRIGFAAPNPSIADLRKFPLRLNKFLFQFLAAREAGRLHKLFGFKLVWAMMAHACGIPAGIFKKSHPNIPYLLTLQEGDPPEEIERSMRFVWPLFKQGFVKADALQAISTFLAKWGKRMGFQGESEVIPNGVVLEKFSRPVSTDAKIKARERLQKKDGGVTLITASRLVPKNAVDDVIRALPHLPEKVMFAVCGIGPDEESLRELAVKEGVANRILWLGEVSHDELPALLQSSDIFIRPSRSEGMGNAFIEAMAAGIPVIATQEGGITDFLFETRGNSAEKGTGFAVKKDAPQEIVEAVNHVLSHPEEVAQTVRNAKDLVMGGYDWNTVSTRMRMVINRLIG